VGTINLPSSGVIYLDTAPIIYSVEKHHDYWVLMQPVWKAAQTKQIKIIVSELALLEMLVAPLKNQDIILTAAYEQLLTKTEVQGVPITIRILREAADLRSQFNLKTPDAIHAATALNHGCDLFVTNDPIFRRVPKLNVETLKDLI
jgi:predicted nucleic acid-binding protein